MSEPERRFEFTFKDESSKGKLALEYGPDDDELLRFGEENGEIFLFANRQGCLALAKVLIKLALGDYRPGFHLHLGQDFSASGLAIGILADDEGDSSRGNSAWPAEKGDGNHGVGENEKPDRENGPN
jgi:hypothetical protein